MAPKALPVLCFLFYRTAAGSSCVSGNCVQQGDETSLMQVDLHVQRRAKPSSESAPSITYDLLDSGQMKEAYLDLLANSLTGALQDEAGSCDGFSPGGCSKTKPYNPAERATGADWPPWGQTMVGFKRLNNIRWTLEDAVKNKIPGDYAELGVWRGGTGIWAKAIFNLLGERSRGVHMFDAWEQIHSYDNLGGGAAPYLAFTEDGVRHNFDKYKVLDDTCKFHKGLFKDTVPRFAQENPNLQLAVLRIDGNFYDSHQDALYNLYEKVPVGGYMIFDDYYGDATARRGWDDFAHDQGCPEQVTQIDHLSGFFRKTKDVKVDRSKMKPPRDCNLP